MIQRNFEIFQEITLLLEKKGADDFRKLASFYASFFIIACLMAKVDQENFENLTQKMRETYPSGMSIFED